MQIIIPMSGFGERFQRAGYRIPKPLIEIEGKPMIAHVIEMFPGETDFIFICNEDHLNEPMYQLRETITKWCPTGQIISIPPHKHGPVHAVLLAAQYINTSRPVVVNYCDFTCYWNWQHFKEWVSTLKCAGAVPAYRDFHPHTLGTTNYAYIREQDHWMQDIQEKQPYTDNRMNEYASSGTYYFDSGQRMLDAFRYTIKQNLNVNGEYYVSLAYKFLLTYDLPVAVYSLQHFMQWGTPEDVDEYNKWSALFHRLSKCRTNSLSVTGTAIIPMAGLGQRFVQAHYKNTKPLIPVSGAPMAIQATHDLPPAKQHVFVLRRDMPDCEEMTTTLLQAYPNAIIESISRVTDGQACTVLLGLDALTEKLGEELLIEPIIIGACDNGALYDVTKLEALLSDTETDIIVFGVRGHINAFRNPQMYGWIEEHANVIKRVSVKTPLLSSKTDAIVLGTFIFKRTHDLRRCMDRMMQRDARINGEFYLDTCINDAIALGLRCTLFEVDHYISWGTPNDLRTYEYWQSCFHKWTSHPYRLELDDRIPQEGHNTLSVCYRTIVPLLLETTDGTKDINTMRIETI